MNVLLIFLTTYPTGIIKSRTGELANFFPAPAPAPDFFQAAPAPDFFPKWLLLRLLFFF